MIPLFVILVEGAIEGIKWLNEQERQRLAPYMTGMTWLQREYFMERYREQQGYCSPVKLAQLRQEALRLK